MENPPKIRDAALVSDLKEIPLPEDPNIAIKLREETAKLVEKISVKENRAKMNTEEKMFTIAKLAAFELVLKGGVVSKESLKQYLLGKGGFEKMVKGSESTGLLGRVIESVELFINESSEK